MSLLQRACKTLGGLGLVIALPSLVWGQTTNTTNYYASQAGEYAPAGIFPGSQAYPAMSLSPAGGYLVWQDNITDGSGLGISTVQLDNTFSPKLANFRVNQQGTNDQQNPQVALLAGGGAAFVWQGGPQSFQHIYARFLSVSNLWITGDIEVNTATNDYQVNPAIVALTNGNVVVTWGSFGQDNADGLQGVYAQILSSNGQKIGPEFQVNQFTPHNQRTPSLAVFPNGNFIITWVSEMQTSSQSVDGSGNAGSGYNSVDIYGRIFNASGTAQTNEFQINTTTNICANPSVAVASDGSYLVAWSQKDVVNLNNSWDIWARQFSSAGIGGAVQTVNSQLYGDQYGPKVSSLGTDYLIVWTSLGEDGSREGVFGQFLHGNGAHAGGETQINTTVLNQQEFPAVASDGVGRFLVAWSSYTSGINGLAVNAQRYATTLQPLSPPGAPMVLALDSGSLSVTWPILAGFNVSYYELFVDGSTTATNLTNNHWYSGLHSYNPGTTHAFQLAYVLSNGQQSPNSATAYGTTWGYDDTGFSGFSDGLPDDWETLYFGSNTANWPKNGALTLLAPGVTVFDVFLWGGNPNDPNTWLKQWINNTAEGYFLNWNTVAGAIYQVQTTTDLKTWTNLGSPRFEAGTTDSLYLGWTAGSFYRIVRNRY